MGTLSTGPPRSPPSAERQAHTTKGAAATVGGGALRELASKLEMLGKDGDLEGVRANLPELQTQFDQLKETMEASSLLAGKR